MADAISLSPKGRVIRIALALGVVAVMAAVMALTGFVMEGAWVSGLTGSIKVSAGILGVNFIIALVMLVQLARVSAWNMTGQILPVWFTLTVIGFVLLLVSRADYSNVFFAANWLMGLVLLTCFSYLAERLSPLRVGIAASVKMDMGDNPARLHIPVDLDGDHDGNENDSEIQRLDVLVVAADDVQTRAGCLARYAVAGIPVMPDHVFAEYLTGRVNLAKTDAAALVQLRPWRRYALIKRLLDIIMAAAGIVVLAPLMLIIAMLIRLETPGGAIFVQTRIGQGGRAFRLYKFRSMIAAEDAGQFASPNDARITRIGRILRTTRLDETPQLFNVLAGSMSIIGPRPEQKALVDELAAAIPLYGFRHAIRPGITGWAQVMQGYADDVASTDVKLSYDIFYIKNLSLMMDLAIFFRTWKIIITGFGSR